MDTIDKRTFLEVLKIKPQSVIGKEIIYSVKPVRILDVSIGGDRLLLESSSTERTWVLASGVDDNVIIDTFRDVRNAKPFTVLSLTQSIKALEELVGQPGSRHPKPLFEIVEALNKELLELRLKIEEEKT